MTDEHRRYSGKARAVLHGNDSGLASTLTFLVFCIAMDIMVMLQLLLLKRGKWLNIHNHIEECLAVISVSTYWYP